MQAYLVDALIFCSIILVLFLSVAAFQLALILLDLRKTTNEVKQKIIALTSMIDIVALIFSGMGSVKKNIGHKLLPGSSTLAAFIAGLKKALQVLFK